MNMHKSTHLQLTNFILAFFFNMAHVLFVSFFILAFAPKATPDQNNGETESFVERITEV